MGFLVVSDTVHVSYRPLRGSTWGEVLMEANRQLQMGSFQAVPAGILFGVVRNIYLIFLLPADLSSYTPKHSVKFSEWQEQKYEGPAAEGPLSKEADSHGNQVMVRL